MKTINHIAIFVTDGDDTTNFCNNLLNKKAEGYLKVYNTQKGVHFCNATLQQLMQQEQQHHNLAFNNSYNRHLSTLSDGEQKKELLSYLLAQQPDYIILENTFDNLDTEQQAILANTLITTATNTSIIQLVKRYRDTLPFITTTYKKQGELLQPISNLQQTLQHSTATILAIKQLPTSPYSYAQHQPLVAFTNVSIAYNQKPIVHAISWTIKAGECWQLIGPNGSGKTTLLSLITGDNPKAYNQNILLFGMQKGTGEAVQDIKKYIGYFSPAITNFFGGYNTVLHLLVGGYYNSVGLYIMPTDIQLRTANEWLVLIGLSHKKNEPFNKLTLGEQRILLIARAIIKLPPLLILDEPTTGLDDANSNLVVVLINTIMAQTNCAILLVSHRPEAGLYSNLKYILTPTTNGSVGHIASH
jgi:molybdate transport system ATP-binding protein